MLALLLAATFATTDLPAPADGPHLALVPLLSYGSDIGVQAGAAIYLYRRLPAHPEWLEWVTLGGAYSTEGPRSIEVKGEKLGLFGMPLSAFFQAKAWDDNGEPYWGEGARLGAPVEPGAGSPPPVYRWHGRGPWVSALLRGPLPLAGLGWFARARYSRITVEDAGPLLAAAHPTGSGGGSVALIETGLFVDTRDRALAPSHGLFADLSIFASPRVPPLSDFAFGGGNASVRVYAPIAPGWVLCGRVLLDLKRGEVPFFERSLYEGLGYGEGFGGAGTVRGVARDRLSGDEKLLASLELRSVLVATQLFGKLQELGVSAGVDAARVQQPGFAAVAGVGAFGGLRLLWDRAVLIRFEAGYAGQGAPGFYVSFGEPF